MSAIEVVEGRCEGHGLCETAAPQLYRLSELGHVEVLVSALPAELVPLAEAGARLCPVNALRVVD